MCIDLADIQIHATCKKKRVQLEKLSTGGRIKFMYGIVTYTVFPKNKPNTDEYFIHVASGVDFKKIPLNRLVFPKCPWIKNHLRSDYTRTGALD